MPDPKTPDSKLRIEAKVFRKDRNALVTCGDVARLAEAVADEVKRLREDVHAAPTGPTVDLAARARLAEIERRLDDADYPADLPRDIPEQRERVRQINKRLRGEHDMPSVDTSGKPTTTDGSGG